VLLELRKRGPHAGIPWLRRVFPEVARGELVELKAVDRARRRAGRARFAARLRWEQAGAVWAIDYAEPPEPIDGRFAAVVSIRDLASGLQLAWLPLVAPTADEAIAVLEGLFRKYGAPLVLKADNGSPFTAERTRALLKVWNVTPLYSPPYTPRYNGSCEAGIGGLKSRTRCLADYDAAGAWTSPHLEAARRMANEEHYPPRLKGRTAAEVWRARAPISEQERRRFRDVVDRLRRSNSALLTSDLEALDPAGRASLDRKAVPQALVELGVLSILRSTVTPTIKPL
jgi:transposase InsO family protein